MIWSLSCGSNPPGAEVEVGVRDVAKAVGGSETEKLTLPVGVVVGREELVGDVRRVVVADEPKLALEELRVRVVRRCAEGRGHPRRDSLGELGARAQPLGAAGLREQKTPDEPADVPAGARVVIQVDEASGAQARGAEVEERVARGVGDPGEDAVREDEVEPVQEVVARR